MKNRLPFPLLLAHAALLILVSPLLLAEPDEPDLLPTASVTIEKLEAKIAETEANSELGEEAKKQRLDLYNKALDNLKAADADTQDAESYARLIDEAPTRMEAQRDQRLQKERADLSAARAQRDEAENQLAELSARPFLIRQRLPLARQQQEELATQLRLPPPGGEDPAISEARQWELESRSQRLNAEIRKLDQELLSQPVRMELLEIERDRALAGEELAGKRVKILEDLVNQKRQDEAEQKLAQAEAIRERAEGRHPLVVRLAERDAALSEEIAGTMLVLGGLTERTEQADRRARWIEADFKSARETIDIGGLSRELGQMLLQQRFLLPDPTTFRHKADDRESTAARIGVRRLSHRQEQRRLRDLDAYVAALATTETPDLLAQLDDELRALARERQALLDRAIEADDLYLAKLGKLESALFSCNGWPRPWTTWSRG